MDQGIRRYLAFGESLGISQRALCSARNPWYRVEDRESPALFFPYLWRNSPRFVLNCSSAVGLNVLHHVYLRDDRGTNGLRLRALAAVLNSSFVRRQVVGMARNYAKGLSKSEPSDLRSIVVPLGALEGRIAEELARLFTQLCLETRLLNDEGSLELIDRIVGKSM